ncbi:MAG: hypothetical protein IKL62_06125 [Clostridia bacterium]|nr:hypothetical protein [Clostridia bacterium]
MNGFYLKPKLFSVLGSYSKPQLIKDIVAGMVHAVVLFFVLLFLMPYAGLIPMPTVVFDLIVAIAVGIALEAVFYLTERLSNKKIIKTQFSHVG